MLYAVYFNHLGVTENANNCSMEEKASGQVWEFSQQVNGSKLAACYDTESS